MKLHFDFYYSKEIEVTTTCWKEYVTYRIRELGDSPGMTEAEYDAQNQHTLRRVEKDGDGWAAMGRVVPRSPRVETVDQTPKRLETADKGNNHPKHEMVVVTGANSGYFHALENFIGSMHFWEPTRPIIVYNLGLSASQVDQVNTWHNVHLEWPRGIPKTYAPHVHALKKYAWKTNAIYESTNKYAATLWLDAGCEVRGPLTDIESILQKDGVFLVQGQDGDMTRWVHDGTLRYFNVERSALSKKPSFAGGIEGWIQNSKAYHKILEPLVECANKKECIDPTGASLGNHRYDQSALSVITYTSGMNIVPHTEFLAARSSQLHADIKKPNTMCIWTARGGSSAYKRYTKSVNKLNPPLTRIKQNTMSVNKLKKPLTSIKHKSQPYVVFSTTTGVTHARESDYDFVASLTAKNWHNMGYIPIVVVVSDHPSHIDMLTEKWSDILPAEAIVIPLVVRQNNAIPVAQISRLFVSLMLPDLSPDSILSTTDADMMIMDKSRFAISGDTDIEIFNGNCCGAHQFPMHSVTMSVQKWRTLFQHLWHNEKSFQDNIIQTTKTFGFESHQQIRHGGAHWSMDQQILSSTVRTSHLKFKLSPGPSRRLHVGNSLSSQKYTDIHLAGFNIKRHNTWMEKMIQTFPKLSVDISTYKKYKDKWYGESHPKAIVNISPKITIKNSIGFNRDEPCDIPCHYTTGSGPVDATVYELRGRRAPPSGISVYMQMEGEHYYPIDTTGWTVENTYRWSSPLLKPYFEWIHYHGKTDIQSKRVAPDAIDGISFLARNCGSRNHREQVVKDLIQQVRVDSMSSCLHNHDKPGTDDKIDIMKRYKFHAAFENGNVRDYVTEKVYLALAAGTVPIYLGAPNIDEFVPKGSIIRVDSFENTAALAQHVQECIANETLYQSYHEWRDRPLNSEFVERFAFTNVSTECRTCRWVYAHKHGLPWDKKSQTFELGAKENLGTIPYFKRFSNNSIFVKTGDIPDMWIRDSTAQVWPLRDDGPLVEKVLNMQSFFILQDPYANSYRDHEVQSPTREDLNLGREGWVATRNYELDSGCYFLRLLYHAWKHHDLAVQKYRQTVETLVNTWKTEQYHEEKSPYRYAELPRNGLGTPVKWTGMTWSGFRPSDDACTYGYHIPSNLFAAKALTYVSEMFPDIKEANVLRQDILTGVQQYGTWADTDGKTRYCYEVDGLGGCNKMDDANVPSLLSIPYLDPEGYDRALWENTYEWIWSSKNPYFYKGTAAEGIGSPHTPHNYIWPMSLVMRGLVDPAQCQVMKALVKKTMTRNTIHESFDKNNVQRLTREDFAWPNALYQEMDC